MTPAPSFFIADSTLARFLVFHEGIESGVEID